MKNFVVECYEFRDPFRMFVREVQAEDLSLVSINFYANPNNARLRINEITEGTWDKENFQIIYP